MGRRDEGSDPVVTLEPTADGKVALCVYEFSSDEIPVVTIDLTRANCAALGVALAKFGRSDA